MTRTFRTTLLAGLCLSAAVVHADDDYFSPTNERLRLSLGVTRVSTSTDLRIDSSTGVKGTPVNAESAFGLDSQDFEPKFQATVRVATRHRLTFDYFTLDRTGNTTLTQPIKFRNVTLVTGDPVQSKLSLRTLGVSYQYSFWHSEKLELAAGLGVHSTDVSARAKVQTQTRHIDQSEDQAGPVPTLGLDATWVISKRFYVDARGQYLSVHVNNLSGSLGFYTLDALYRYRPNVALGLGYTEIRAHLESTQASQGGLFDFNTHGPEMFFRVSF